MLSGVSLCVCVCVCVCAFIRGTGARCVYRSPFKGIVEWRPFLQRPHYCRLLGCKCAHFLYICHPAVWAKSKRADGQVSPPLRLLSGSLLGFSLRVSILPSSALSVWGSRGGGGGAGVQHEGVCLNVERMEEFKEPTNQLRSDTKNKGKKQPHWQ